MGEKAPSSAKLTILFEADCCKLVGVDVEVFVATQPYRLQV